MHVARIKPLCALRAAGLVARGQLQQMNDSATSQLDGMRASRDDHVEAHRQQEVRRWTSVLGVVHTEVLGQLGLAHTDPEHCFDKVLGRTFARCCSVGEHVAECWPRELSGLDDKSDHIDRVAMGRCCVKADVPVQLVARVAGQLGSASPRRPDPGDLIPAVAAWLQDPTGVKWGSTLSGAAVDLLFEPLDGHRLGVPRRRARHPAWAGSWERDLSGARFLPPCQVSHTCAAFDFKSCSPLG